ncbi:MAG: hypothetical protein ACFE8B_03510 [Candidatus Hermodarchaeota archaeon]
MKKQVGIISIINEKHVTNGILISLVITTIVYIITSIPYLPTGQFLYIRTLLAADLQFIIGNVIGERYSLKQCQPKQPFLKYGMIVGIVGGIFSALIISIYQTFLDGFRGFENFNFLVFLFIYIGTFLISGVVIGLLTGAIVGTYYMYKEAKAESKIETDDKIDDDFYKDLLDE